MDLSKPFHDRLLHDPEKGEMRDGSIRYLMMRPDALMGLFDRLPLAARGEALNALVASVADHGGKSVNAYRENGAGDVDGLLQTIVATSAALGWGRWRFDRSQAGRVEVIIENSPFAAASAQTDLPACAPIMGILTALAPLLLAREDVQVTEDSCCAVTSCAHCNFVIAPLSDE